MYIDKTMGVNQPDVLSVKGSGRRRGEGEGGGGNRQHWGAIPILSLAPGQASSDGSMFPVAGIWGRVSETKGHHSLCSQHITVYFTGRASSGPQRRLPSVIRLVSYVCDDRRPCQYGWVIMCVITSSAECTASENDSGKPRLMAHVGQDDYLV